MYRLIVAHGDTVTTSDPYVLLVGDLPQLIDEAPVCHGDGWNSHAWIEDMDGNMVWNRDFPVSEEE